MLKSDFMLYFWNFIVFLFWILIVVTVIKLLIVLFKADRTLDELREYMKRRS
ncbi:hypothetical protein [Spirosoma harenae]